MKAEEILKLIERAGMSDLKITHIKEYARIQIEKDRQKISEEFINQGLVGCSDIINEMPISLK